MLAAQRKLRGVGISAGFALALVASPLVAQNPRSQLTLAGQTITFPAPTAADYVNGFVNSATGMTFTVDATNGNQSHTTTVLIRSTSANLGNGKVIGDLQWRRSDLAIWNSITVTDAQVEQRVQVRNGLNDPWGNTIFFRMLLNWTSDAPATYTANYRITLSQTVP
ncbi:MAG TPA: hypothetical protein VGN73_06540 [Gemmatimonadaceae bacterium]|jgi:hypothetical protein|nr:hypothetical protein [Gemmatimonadaceae bacterium]